MAQKKSKKLFSEILIQQEKNLTRNEKQGNDVTNLFFTISFYT